MMTWVAAEVPIANNDLLGNTQAQIGDKKCRKGGILLINPQLMSIKLYDCTNDCIKKYCTFCFPFPRLKIGTITKKLKKLIF